MGGKDFYMQMEYDERTEKENRSMEFVRKVLFQRKLIKNGHYDQAASVFGYTYIGNSLLPKFSRFASSRIPGYKPIIFNPQKYVKVIKYWIERKYLMKAVREYLKTKKILDELKKEALERSTHARKKRR